MTLNTRLYVLDPIDPMDLIKFCNESLLKADNPSFEMGPAKFGDDKEIIQYCNDPGQGFAAWLDGEWRNGGIPLLTEDEMDDDNGETYLVTPTCFMEISFDTGYSYSDEFGGCATLHARWIVEIYNFLKERGVRLRWKNEFTGDIFDGLNGIDDFMGDGMRAGEWFREILPVIAAAIESDNLEKRF